MMYGCAVRRRGNRETDMKKTLSLRVLLLVLIMSMGMPAGSAFAAERSKKIRNGYDEEGNFYDSKGYKIQKSTILHLLETAIEPVGRTMYIWGGGHAGKEQTMIGVSPQWEKFFNKQKSNYNYRNTINITFIFFIHKITSHFHPNNIIKLKKKKNNKKGKDYYNLFPIFLSSKLP